VVPEFYEVGPAGLPHRWIERAIRSVVTVPGIFNTDRMVGEYYSSAYRPAFEAGRA
jgi:starch phosphorylase